jgi:fluoroquinolone transport system permease protein
MNALAILRTLGPIDARTLRRDSFLRWIVLLPLLLGAGLYWFVPALTQWLITEYDFDLVPYHTLITSYMTVLMVPVILGQVLGFMLLDERDDGTLRALLITPMPIEGYLAYRIGLPLLGSSVIVIAVLVLANLAPLPWYQLGPIALLYAIETPIMTLLMAGMCENKVQGFAFGKTVGNIMLIPVAAYFVDPPWQYLAGVLPPFWTLKAFWLASEGSPGFGVTIAVGLAVHIAALAWLIKRFNRNIHR